VERVRDADEAWRIRLAIRARRRCLRALWQWREKEAAKQWTGPPFHILQNDELVRAAESFAAGTCRL